MSEHHHGQGFDYDRLAEMRKTLVNTEKIIEFMGVKKGDIIADVGSGDGYYSLLFSPLCAKVYSIDHSEDGTERERKKILEKDIPNIEVIKKDACQMSSLPEVSRVFFSTSFHDFPCQDRLIRGFSSKQKPIFTLIEFKKDAEFGPPMEIKLSPEELDKIFKKNGYVRKNILYFEHHYVANYVTES